MKLFDWLKTVVGGKDTDEMPDPDDVFEGLSVAEALRAHMEWMRRFEAALSRGAVDIDPELVAHHDRCVLGKWIHAQKEAQSALAKSPLFATLHEDHSDFHRTASVLAQAIKKRDGTEAKFLLELLRKKSRAIRLHLAELLSESLGQKAS